MPLTRSPAVYRSHVTEQTVLMERVCIPAPVDDRSASVQHIYSAGSAF